MLLSIAAVALSSALLIVVASLFTGFINAFEQSAVDAMGDVVLTPPKKIADYQELTKELEGLDVVNSATVTLSAQGLLNLGRGNVRAVEIWGIEVQKQGKVTAFGRSLFKGPTELKQMQSEKNKEGIEGYVGIGVLTEPNETTDEYDFNTAEQMIGQQVVLTTGSTVNEQDGSKRFKRRTIQFSIADVVFTGVYYLDNRMVYLPIESLQKALYPDSPPIAGQIQIKLRKGADAESALAQISGVWRTFAEKRLGWDDYEIRATHIETAIQMQSRFMAEVHKQMGLLLLIFGIVSLSAVLLIFCIFYMIVETRRKDIAILKSCGAAGVSVATIFLGFGGCIGIIGAAFGTLLGYLVTRNINVVEGWVRVIFGLKLWKSSVYMFSRIPSEVDWGWVLPIVLASIIAACLGALVPAISAAIHKPVNILRYE